MERRKTIWDFMCEHPFITAIMFSSLCETIRWMRKPPGLYIHKEDSHEDEPEVISSEEAPDDLKDAGNTEENTAEEPKEDN